MTALASDCPSTYKMVQCYVPSCKNNSDRSKDWKKRLGSKQKKSKVSFHRFPKDPIVRSLWLNYLNINTSLIPTSARICSEHFEEKNIDRSTLHVRINRNALPKRIQKEYEINVSSVLNVTIMKTEADILDNNICKTELIDEEIKEQKIIKEVIIEEDDLPMLTTTNINATSTLTMDDSITKPSTSTEDGAIPINFCGTVDKSKIRVIFEYEFRRGTNAARTARNINDVFGKNVADERTVRRWFEKFRSGDFNLENEPRGRPETKVDNDELKAVVETDTSQTTRELAARFDVTIPTILNHLKQIGKIKKLDRWVPHKLNECQKRNRFEACLSLLSRHKGESFLHRIVTCDEKWILFDNRKHSAQWLGKDEARKPNIHQKLMVSVWWTSAGIIHYSFMKPGQSITADVYCNQLYEMMRKLAIKQPRLINKDRPILLQDNARPYVAQTTLLKLQELNLENLCHPLNSPDLAPTDYHFFQALDHFLQGKTFDSQQAVENAFRDFITTRSSGFFAAGINKLPLKWQNCVDSLGAYFD